MRKNRYVEKQIIKALKEHAAGLSAADPCRKYGVNDASLYKWRSRYGGLERRKSAAIAIAEPHRMYLLRTSKLRSQQNIEERRSLRDPCNSVSQPLALAASTRS
jgi:putative transposase